MAERHTWKVPLTLPLTLQRWKQPEVKRCAPVVGQADRRELRLNLGVLLLTQYSFLYLCNTHTHMQTHALQYICMCITFLVPGILNCNHRSPDDRVYVPPGSQSTMYFPVHFFQEIQSQTISHPVLKIKLQTIKNQPTPLCGSVAHSPLHTWFLAFVILSYKKCYRWRLGFEGSPRNLFTQ